MSTHPLTHHEILALVEPFARRGRRVDLQATDRFARRIVFKPVDRAADGALPAMRETLVLEPTDGDAWRLTRTLTLDDGGTEASLQASGPRPDELLARIDAIPPTRQLAIGDGSSIAMAHRLDAADPTAPIIVRGTVRVDGLVLSMKVPTVSGISADVSITADADDPIVLPDDLFAVLGRAWGPLDHGAGGWNCQVGLRGSGRPRLADAEAKLRRMAGHLARTLAEPPARFHERLRAARWRVAARRTIPLVACIALMAGAAAVPSLGLARESPIWMLIFNAPPLLLLGFFCLREIPRIELPRAPRTPRGASWRASPRPPMSSPTPT